MKVMLALFCVDPESTVSVLLMVVRPFKAMVPVPVLNVPVPEIEKFPEAWV